MVHGVTADGARLRPDGAARMAKLFWGWRRRLSAERVARKWRRNVLKGLNPGREMVVCRSVGPTRYGTWGHSRRCAASARRGRENGKVVLGLAAQAVGRTSRPEMAP